MRISAIGMVSKFCKYCDELRPTSEFTRDRSRPESPFIRVVGLVDVVVAAEESGDLVEGSLGGRQADALERPVGELGQSLERERQVRAPLGGRQRVDLVDDHGLDAAERAVEVAHDRDPAAAVGHDHEAVADQGLDGLGVQDLERLG